MAYPSFLYFLWRKTNGQNCPQQGRAAAWAFSLRALFFTYFTSLSSNRKSLLQVVSDEIRKSGISLPRRVQTIGPKVSIFSTMAVWKLLGIDVATLQRGRRGIGYYFSIQFLPVSFLLAWMSGATVSEQVTGLMGPEGKVESRESDDHCGQWLTHGVHLFDVFEGMLNVSVLNDIICASQDEACVERRAARYVGEMIFQVRKESCSVGPREPHVRHVDFMMTKSLLKRDLVWRKSQFPSWHLPICP